MTTRRKVIRKATPENPRSGVELRAPELAARRQRRSAAPVRSMTPRSHRVFRWGIGKTRTTSSAALLAMFLAVQSGCGSDGTTTTASTSQGGNASTEDGPNLVSAEFVTAHNAVREAVAEPEDYPGNWTSLAPVTWSETVASTAEDWASHLANDLNCSLEHDTASGYGENLAMGSRMIPSTAVQLWASEDSDYSFDPSYAFDPNTGHYTQIVWRKSVEIGCGIASCDTATVVCCRYSPAGNVIGQQPY